jgi:arsenate reductase
VPTEPIRVLFLCTGNSARSQMAEALLGARGGSDFQVVSAGTEPHGLNPYTVRVLAESGIDWSGAKSKSVNEFVGKSFDYVVTVCDQARQTCPFLPGRHRRLHWDLEDPAAVEGTDAQKIEAFRHTMAELEARLPEFIAEARRSS